MQPGGRRREIYGWFTEGFGTADVNEAKALIEQLGNSSR